MHLQRLNSLLFNEQFKLDEQSAKETKEGMWKVDKPLMRPA